MDDKRDKQDTSMNVDNKAVPIRTRKNNYSWDAAAVKHLEVLTEKTEKNFDCIAANDNAHWLVGGDRNQNFWEWSSANSTAAKMLIPLSNTDEKCKARHHMITCTDNDELESIELRRTDLI